MGDFELDVQFRTWVTWSQVEEFDREDVELHRVQALKVGRQSCSIFQDQKDFTLSQTNCEQTSPSENQKEVLNIRQNKNGHFVVKSPQKPMYQIIGSKITPDNFSHLKVGDVLKFGKKVMIIMHLGYFKMPRETNYVTQNMSVFQKDQARTMPIQTVLSEDLSLTILNQIEKCRYCLGQTRKSTNPVINCCGCKGLDNHLHLKCLERWIETKCPEGVLKIGSNFMVPKKSVKCEVCLQYYKFKYTIPILLKEELSSFILMEDSQILYGIYCKGQESMSIGRSNNSYLHLSENTVSRLHAQIFYSAKHDRFLIRDLKSKFGSLRRVESCRVQSQLQIQVGRNIVKLRRREKKSLLSSIFGRFCRLQPDDDSDDKSSQPTRVSSGTPSDSLQ